MFQINPSRATLASGVTVNRYTARDGSWDGDEFRSAEDEIRDAEWWAAHQQARAQGHKAAARRCIADARDHRDDRKLHALALRDAAIEIGSALIAAGQARGHAAMVAWLRQKAATRAAHNLHLAAE